MVYVIAMAMAYQNSVIPARVSKTTRAQKKQKQQKAPKPPKTKKPKKGKKNNAPILNPTRGPALPSTPAVPTPAGPTATDFATLADLYREIFGPQIGFAPDTSQSGESVLVVPGDEGEGGSNKGMIILILIVLGAGGYYLYKKSKKAA